MSDVILHTAPSLEKGQLPPSPAGAGKAALTEATKNVDLIHTSLAGMTAIVVVLLFAVALPVWGRTPVVNLMAFEIMVLTSLAGIGYLYYMNYRVHQHVSTQARLTEVLVNSLGQGFLSFNRDGLCGQVYSQACVDLLETIPAGKNIMDVLYISDANRADFKDWMDILFMPNHALSFDDVIRFMPQFFPHSQGRRISLMYRPIHAKDGSLLHLMLIATDQTEEYEAQQRAERQQNYADMICRIFKERNQFLATVTHIRKWIDAAAYPIRREDAAPLLRSLHTMKAAVKHFHLDEASRVVSRLETELRSGDIRSEEDFTRCLVAGREEVRVCLITALDQVKDLIGQDYEGRGNMHEVEEDALYQFARDMENKNVDKTLIRLFLSTIAAVPASDCFRIFERELYDLAEMIGKQVKPVRYTGTGPRILTQPIQEFLFSLTHVCRNIVDHGIEPPVTRLARGKDPAGQVSINVDTVLDDERKSEMLHIIIADDGNGIDPSAIRARLSLLDPHGAWRTADDQAIIQSIFSSGFSTRENVTDLSGRGIGMEAVEREVKLLGGEIRVYSELYRGTRFDIRIPYIFDLQAKKVDLSRAVAL